MRLRWHLAILVLAALVPLVVFTAALVQRHLEDQRDVLQRGMRDTVRALSVAVEGEVKASWALLETLAVSPLLDAGDLPGFHALCGRAIAGRPEAWIVLFDRSGQQVLNSRRPFGSPLPNPFRETQPPSADPRYPDLPLGGAQPVRRVFETGRPLASDLFIALDSRRPTVAVAVPVIRDGQAIYALEMSIDPEAFTQLLREQRLPADAVEAVLDGKGLVIARTLDPASRLGRPLVPEMAAQVARTEEGAGEGQTWEGVPVYHAFTRSRLTGWRTSIAVSRAVVEGPLNRSVVFLAGGAVFVLLVGLGAALVIGKRIAAPISRLAGSAEAITHGETVALSASAVREVRDLGDALVAAGEATRAAASEREHRLVAEARQAEAQAANRAKDEFLAMLGHELRNPLGVIASAASLLSRHDTPEGLARRSHTIISRQVRHLSRLVDDLLDVSRVTSGRVTLLRQPVDLAELVANVVHEWRTSGQFDRHQLVLNPSPVWVEGDIARLEQILGNLVTNALKFTPAGGTIEVSVGRDQAVAVLSVRDTGIGIPADLLPRIFDLFIQGRSGLDRAGGGLGIGLTLVRQLSEMHGGTVIADSEGENRGSVFTLRLPAISPPAAAARPAAAPVTMPVCARRVLIVEDHDDARELLRETLIRQGHQVFEASDGPGGVEAAQRLRPDVALIDIGLPGLDGYEVARQIRRLASKSMRLVALTGYGRPEDRDRALEAGFDGYVVKPVDPVTLEATLFGDASPRSVGAMAYQYDAIEAAVDQRRWSQRLRHDARTARRRTRELHLSRRTRGPAASPGSRPG